MQSRELQRHAARPCQREALDLGDQPGFLCQRDELERRHDLRSAPPAQQRLHAGQAPVGEIDDRLHDQLELLERECPVKCAHDLDAARRGLAETRVEQLKPASSTLLGRVHRDVRVPDQGGRRLRITATDGDPDATADVDLAAPDGNGCASVTSTRRASISAEPASQSGR